MDKIKPDSPKLTENDKKVLKKILDLRLKKISDSEIGKEMNISPQAVFKIRQKLESNGIVKGYMPIIDFKKIGINVMVLLVIRITNKIWDSFSDAQVSERISSTPYIIHAYRVSDEQASHALIFGFRDTAQKERYIAELQTKFAEEVHITAVYTFSVDKIISENPLGLLHEIIDKKEFTPKDLFLTQATKK